nr:substrate-binding domain-containing protein [Solirubrobacterales bacterium]
MKSHLWAKPARLVLCLFAMSGLAAAFASAATTAAESTAAEKGSLIWVQPLRNHPVHRIMQAGFLSECKKLGWKCEIVGNPSATSFDVPASVALARSALAAGKFKGAAIYAVDPTLYPFVKEVSKMGLPVVSWHVPVPKVAAPGLTAVTGTDPAKYAKAAALVIG